MASVVRNAGYNIGYSHQRQVIWLEKMFARQKHLSNGFLCALLHLMAVCSVPDNGIVAIDEPENGLHPYGVKMLIEALRERAQERHLTILLATHSGFILNEFKEEAHRVYVMEQNGEQQLSRLDTLEDPEWLKHFSLGDLYGKQFGIQ